MANKSVKAAARKLDKTSVLYGLYYLMQSQSLPSLFHNAHQTPHSLVIRVAGFNCTTLGKLLNDEERSAFRYLLITNYNRAKSGTTWNDLLRLPVSCLVSYLVDDMDEDDLEDSVDTEETAAEEIEVFVREFLRIIYSDSSHYEIGLENMEADVSNFLVDILVLNFGVEPEAIQGTISEFSKFYGNYVDMHRQFNRNSKKGKSSKSDDDTENGFDDRAVASPGKTEIGISPKKDKLPKNYPMNYEDLFSKALSQVDCKVSRKISPRDFVSEIDKVELNLSFLLSRIKNVEEREEARQLIFKIARLS